jgi:hypothetical protein
MIAGALSSGMCRATDTNASAQKEIISNFILEKIEFAAMMANRNGQDAA